MMFCCPLEHVGTQNPLPGGLQLCLLYVNCGHSCGRGPAPDALGHGAGSDHCVGGEGLQILPFPCVPTLLPWDESGQGCCSETPGNVANPRAPLPLSSHSPACLENPALPVTRAPGTGAGNIPVASTSFRLQGSHLSPGASSWTEVTASLRASYSCSFSNAFSRLQPEG